MPELIIIGRAEKAELPRLTTKKVPVKIDTGADACSIWAQAVELENKQLEVVFFGKGSTLYDGKTHIFQEKEYTMTRVANSFGHREIRYKVKLGIKLKGRLIRGSFTLSNRKDKLYPVLIGRSLLRNKFLVDVAKGAPLKVEEKQRAEKLRADITDLRGDAL